MTNDPERIRALLEPHGYHIAPANATIFGRPIQVGPWLIGPTGGLFAPTGDDPSWGNVLAHFLNDKAQDSARIKDLARTDSFNPETWEKAGMKLRYDEVDPHELFVEWWLSVHDLTDPRQPQGNL